LAARAQNERQAHAATLPCHAPASRAEPGRRTLDAQHVAAERPGLHAAVGRARQQRRAGRQGRHLVLVHLVDRDAPGRGAPPDLLRALARRGRRRVAAEQYAPHTRRHAHRRAPCRAAGPPVSRRASLGRAARPPIAFRGAVPPGLLHSGLQLPARRQRARRTGAACIGAAAPASPPAPEPGLGGCHRSRYEECSAEPRRSIHSNTGARLHRFAAPARGPLAWCPACRATLTMSILTL